MDDPAAGSVLRYSSELAAAGPNDMQMLWLDSLGATEEGLALAQLSAAVMRVFYYRRRPPPVR